MIRKHLQSKKIGVLATGIVVVLNSTLGSSLPSNATVQINSDFNVDGEASRVLPISMYLIGYIFGPVVFAPLSETYGRQRIMQFTFIAFMIFMMATALAPNWTAFLLFRMFTGIAASSPIAVTGGIYADLFDDPVARGRTMAIFISVSSEKSPEFPPQSIPVPLLFFIICFSQTWSAEPGCEKYRGLV